MGNIYVSPGNRKLGGIPSISLDPRRTCVSDITCRQKCYAMRMMRFRNNIKVSWERNTQVWNNEPDGYFRQLRQWIDKHNPPYFRFHVGGDIPNIRYFLFMADLADQTPNTKYLCFTKRYTGMGQYIETMREGLDNVRLLLSAWPFQIPEHEFLFNVCAHESRKMPNKIAVSWIDDDPRVDTMAYKPTLCKNNCSICHACWESDGDIILHKH